jgi:hypothetical protein
MIIGGGGIGWQFDFRVGSCRHGGSGLGLSGEMHGENLALQGG